MNEHSKIVTLEQLEAISGDARACGQKIVLCHGVFDLLHIGHIRYLRRAKELADVLIVTITQDQYVDKGPNRPAFNELLRAEAVASLDCVDYVAVNRWPSAVNTITLLRPDIYAKGVEYKNLVDATGNILREVSAVEAAGGRIEFIEDIVFSSSSLINKYIANFSEECREYLSVFRKRHSAQEIIDRLDRLKSLDVLVVGDTIVDEYVYCSPLGSSTKDPVLAVLYQSQDLFAGGAAAVANHVAQLANSVTFCTVTGNDGQGDFIKDKLLPNVRMLKLTRPDAPTVKKTRFLDGYSFQKQLELYHMKPGPIPDELDKELSALVESKLGAADLVLAADFGNGCIGPTTVATLCQKAPFLAVNTQANAGNRGYHTIGKYPTADFISLASHEIALEYRNQSYSRIDMMLDLHARINKSPVLVTEGRNGCAILDANGLQRSPSFAANVVDRVGAGDALFSLTALCAFLGFPADMTAFLGNIAGSLCVENIGNAKAISRHAIDRFITSILK